jgi:hypothetical protein
MIPKDFITAWKAHAPWRLDAQVELDLVISRAIVDLFSMPEVASKPGGWVGCRRAGHRYSELSSSRALGRRVYGETQEADPDKPL